MRHILLLLALLPLSGCDEFKERMGFPSPARIEADGKAIGGACRHAGRGLEDCYRLNPEASKAAVYGGWKEMNEYMAKNNMAVVEPTIPPEMLTPPEPTPPPKKKKKAEDEGEEEPAEGKPADDHAAEGKAAEH